MSQASVIPFTDGEFTETEQRIIDATLTCLDRWGVDKTSLNDIAHEAGVTRPTVYRYFPGKEDIVQAALLQVGFRFGQKLFNHISQFDTPAERVIEAIMFTFKQLPKEPYLGLAVKNEMASYINERALASQESLEIRHALFAEILNHDSRYMPDIEEIVEVTTRFTLSLLIVDGGKKRNDKEMRAFLTRRLLPALGLHK